MRALKAFGRFWFDFVIGDDPKIAAAVVLAIGLVVGLLEGGVFGDHALTVLGGLAVLLFFSISLLFDVRSKR